MAEIWLRSPGGDARAGNEAGRIIRRNLGLTTRIPSGSACFSACNFVFMGGIPRYVDPGGLFIVHMFTRTGDRSTIRSEEHTSELQSLMRISYAVFCLKKKNKQTNKTKRQSRHTIQKSNNIYE